MLDRLKRLRKAWKLSGKDYFVVSKMDITDEELKTLVGNGKVKEITNDTGEGGFLGDYMTEHEVAQSIKENELGWKKIFDRVRNLGKDTQDGI